MQRACMHRKERSDIAARAPLVSLTGAVRVHAPGGAVILGWALVQCTRRRGDEGFELQVVKRGRCGSSMVLPPAGYSRAGQSSKAPSRSCKNLFSV